MKLVRLVANGSNQFNNDINADFTLKPNSQIALLNGNFQKKSKQLIINSQNDKFTYTIGTYTKTTDALTHRTINDDNFEAFIQEIQAVINESLSVSDGDVTGMGWRLKMNDKNKLEIETFYGLNFDPFGAMEKDDAEEIGNNIYRKANALNEGVADGALFFPTNNLQIAFDGVTGCGFFRCQLNKLSAAGAGCFIALNEQTGDDLGGSYTFNTSKVTFGIYAKNTGSNYEIITPSGGLQVSAEAVETAVNGDDDNDILSIETNLGKIRLMIYNKSNPNGVLLAEEEYTASLELHPLVGFYDQTDVEIKTLRYTPEDASSVNPPIISAIFSSAGVSATTLNPPNQTTANIGVKSPMNLTFPSLEFANFLGFNEKIIDESPEEIFKVKSDNSIYLVDTSESYIVEMENLKVMSYDGLLQQRKNILQVVQNGRDSAQPDFVYQTNTPIFLDLDNAFPIQLRNIECRIVNSDYQDVEIVGEANLTILFKEKGE